MNMVYLMGRVETKPYLVNDDSTEIPYVFHTIIVPTERKDEFGSKINEYVNIWLEGEMAEQFVKYAAVTKFIGVKGELRTDADGDKFVYVTKFSVAVPNLKEGEE
jgi:hypothetical protein